MGLKEIIKSNAQCVLGPMGSKASEKAPGEEASKPGLGERKLLCSV